MSKWMKTVCVVWLAVFLGTALFFPHTFSAKAIHSSLTKRTTKQGAATDSSSQTTEIRKLTSALVALNVKYQMASEADKSQLLDDLRAIAAKRQQILAALTESDPGEVLRVALPANIRASLPPAVRAYIEQHVELEGALEVLYEDREIGSRLRFFLDSFGGRLPLHFATDPPTHLLTGSRVRVKGVWTGESLALDSGSSTTSLSALSTALPNTFGAQKVLVILVNFQDKQTQPYTLDTARSLVFTTTSNFDLEASFQQTWLTGDVVGWYTIPLSSTVCDSSSIASYAKQAAQAAGVNLSAYTRYVYAFPQNACSWWGLGSVGGNPSNAWINGSLALKVIAHEMGHNFGLYHANALVCGTTTIGSNCTSSEYGDTIDMMGQQSAGHFNAFQKERLGWLNYGTSPAITTVQADGLYRVDPFESQGSNPKALKILKSTDPTTGKKTWYYVECRRALGFDGFLSSNSNVLGGVVVHTGSESSGNSSYLLDMTPSSPSSFGAPALPVGQSFYDPNVGVTITPVSVDNTGAAVNVSFGPLACVPAKPTVTVSPAQSQWVRPGTAVTYTVSVTDNDNTGCATSNFNLQATVPSGWTATFAAPTLSISPGASASTTLTVTSPTTATDGFYTVGVTAANSADTTYSASASVTYVVVSALSVAVSTNQSSYTRNQMLYVTATVSANGSPVSGASVSFTITRPNGAVITGTATTGTNGAAVYKYKFKHADPVGTYRAGAVANMNGISGSATTSFTLQ
jgi:M6 family metalloprotease-like protein